MIFTMKWIYCLAIICLLSITSCGKTVLLSTWKDDRYRGDIKKVLILGVSENPGIRKIFEQEFSNQLKSRGITALPSNQIIPSDKMLDKDTIVSKMKELNMDAVIVTRLVEKKTVTAYYPNWYDHYTRSYGRQFKDEVVNLETNLYDVRTEKMIWSALSETVIMEEDSTYKKIKSFIEVVVDNLSKENLI